jgi:hypothetical protein
MAADRKRTEQRPGPVSPQEHVRPGDEAPSGAPGSGENVCPRCGGSGRIERGERCPECEGSGRVTTGIGGA